MAEIGPTSKGGSCRLTLTDEDKQGRDLFVKWCKDAGCNVEIDEVGSIFARRKGKRNTPSVATGSHLDTQPTGGRFDGIYGVLAGLEVIRCLNERNIETTKPIEVVSWTNEEGSRFSPPMLGSGVFCGVHTQDYAYGRTDLQGKTFKEELQRIGYLGNVMSKQNRYDCFFETHIEQGPILEAEKKTIGVVTGAQGQKCFEVDVNGEEAHSGTTPMNLRKDALQGAASMVSFVEKVGMEYPPTVATVGRLQVFPNSFNTIPGLVKFTIDIRNPHMQVLEKIESIFRSTFSHLAKERKLSCNVTTTKSREATFFDVNKIGLIRQTAAELGYSHMDIISGAGHDSCYLANVVPTAMIFVPCERGISHNEAENASPEDLSAGCDVLLHSMLKCAL